MNIHHNYFRLYLLEKIATSPGIWRAVEQTFRNIPKNWSKATGQMKGIFLGQVPHTQNILQVAKNIPTQTIETLANLVPKGF